MQLDAKKLKAIEEMLDRDAIRECLNRYMRAVDRHDEELMATVYHPEALDDHTMYIGKGVEFGPSVNAFHDSMWCAHTHYLTNARIELSGNTAHVESYFLAALRRKDNSGTDLSGGRYIDRFEKRDGEWKIAARVCVYEWGQNPEEIKAALSAFPLGKQDKSDLSNVRPLKVTRSMAQFQLGNFAVGT